jgi:AMP phosphorylase
MEVLANVTFTKEQIYKIVEKTNGCIVWGGGFKIAPADDEIIQVEEPLALESYDKILVSVMAKKIAFGSNHVVIDIPYGRTMKIHHKDDAESLARKFKYLADRFDMKLTTIISRASEPAGCGIGPLLEARDALKVLEQKEDRPIALEERSLKLAAELLKLCLENATDEIKEKSKNYSSEEDWAKQILTSGDAHKRMLEIIEAQGGDLNITSDKLHAGPKEKDVKASRSGKVESVNNRNISIIAKILGAPQDREAGIYLQKRIGDKIEKNEIKFTIYAETDHRIEEAVDSLDMFPIYEVE